MKDISPSFNLWSPIWFKKSTTIYNHVMEIYLMNDSPTYGDRLRKAMLDQETPELRAWSDRIFNEQNAIDTVRMVGDLRYRFPSELRSQIEDLQQRLRLVVQEDPPDLDEARRLLDQIHELEMRLKMVLQKPQTPLSQKMNKNLTMGQKRYEMMRKSSFGE